MPNRVGPTVKKYSDKHYAWMDGGEPTSTNHNLVFVYGTLMSDQWNNYIMDGQELMGKARTVGKYYRPNFISVMKEAPPRHSDKAHSIPGELWSVDDLRMERLDRLEQIEWGTYVREVIPVICNGEQVMAYIYFRNPSQF